jgi:hypothetical protein
MCESIPLQPTDEWSFLDTVIVEVLKGSEREPEHLRSFISGDGKHSILCG